MWFQKGLGLALLLIGHLQSLYRFVVTVAEDGSEGLNEPPSGLKAKAQKLVDQAAKSQKNRFA